MDLILQVFFTTDVNTKELINFFSQPVFITVYTIVYISLVMDCIFTTMITCTNLIIGIETIVRRSKRLHIIKILI